MCHLLYKKSDDKRGSFSRAKPIKLYPDRLEQVVLPSVFHKEEDNILKEYKVDATMADHLLARGPTHSRKTQDHHLMQLGGAVLPRCEVFLATWSNIKRLSCLVGRTASALSLSSHTGGGDSGQASIDCSARHEVYKDYQCAVVSSQRTYLDQE